MQLKSFDDFLKGLHDEIVRLEFAHYDFKNQVSKLLKVTISSSVPGLIISVQAKPFSASVMIFLFVPDAPQDKGVFFVQLNLHQIQ